MTVDQPGFDSHAMAAMDAFRSTFLLDNNKDPVTTSTTTIADHIDYQLSQMDSSYTLNSANTATTTTTTSGSPISSFMNNLTSSQDLIDRSNVNQAEHVLEWSPNKRYCRLNTLLGKGAFKVVHKAMDREEGYEVAWNVLHVSVCISN
jgi:WNK lysine deficient protein kinase